MLYPSVTFCPKYAWKTFPGVNKIVVKLPCKGPKFIGPYLRQRNTFNNADMKVMEMINKNVSTFEALKKHAIKDYWNMDEVHNPIFQMFM